MENNQKGIKNYWNIIKIELSKNKRVFLLFLPFIVLGLVLLWNATASASVMEKLIMLAPFVAPFVILILFIPIALASRRRYENSIVGKNPWEIAEVNFRRNAKLFPIFMAMLVFLSFWQDSSPHSRLFESDPRMELLKVAVVSVVAFILFLVLASLFKRKSPKAIAVGYTCLVSLLIPSIFVFFYTFFGNRHGQILFWIFWCYFPTFLIQGLVFIYKASKYTANIKRDSELQNEIAKIKEEK